MNPLYTRKKKIQTLAFEVPQGEVQSPTPEKEQPKVPRTGWEPPRWKRPECPAGHQTEQRAELCRCGKEGYRCAGMLQG